MNLSFSKVITAFSAISLILLYINGCDSLLNQKSQIPNQPRNAASQANIGVPKKPHSLNYDQKLVQLSKNIPGFGGLYINKSGKLVIYLTHPAAQKAQASSIFSSFKPLTKTLARLRTEGQSFQSASVANMIIKKGQYTFTKLYNWKTKVTGKMLGTMAGVYSNDINEAKNKIYIGVKDEAAKTKVSKRLAQLDIPKNAVTIFKMSRPVSFTSLRDNVSSFSGGLKISFLDNSYVAWCTMGPTVRYRENASGPLETGYITSSHCTPPLGGGVHGTQFWQSTLNGNFAGTEIRDPIFAHDKCWDTGTTCRESDAALISYSNSNPYIVPGSIYKTTSRGRNNGSITLISIFNRFYIKAIDNFIPQGITNDKIGARTGWTYGPVSSICCDFTVEGFTKVCQNVVQAGANHGDSGAPVFEYTATSDSVIFDGVLSGGYTMNGKQYYYYSSVTRIKSDLKGFGSNLNKLIFTAPPPPLLVTISGPEAIYSNGSYSWEAHPENGNGTYSYQWKWRKEVLGFQWEDAGGGQIYSQVVQQSNQTWFFQLKVILTSGSEQATSNVIQVAVTRQGCTPPGICFPP